MVDLLPCPCRQGCSLSVSAPGGGPWRVVAYPCGTEGPVRGGIVVTEEHAATAWNEWVMGIAKKTMAGALIR